MDTRLVLVTRWARDAVSDAADPDWQGVVRNPDLAPFLRRIDAAPSLADLRERVAAACVQGANAQLDDPSRPWQSFAADAVLAVLLGTDSEEASCGE